MDSRQYMIIDLERTGDKNRFITDNVSSISMNANGQWRVQFVSSQRIFHYNPYRLLCLTHPETIDLEEKGLYINNKHVDDIKELLCFDNHGRKFYHVIHNNGYSENMEGNDVYITRTRIDRNGGDTWDYLKKLAEETSLTTDKDESILSWQYDKVDVKRDNVPLAQYLGSKDKLKTFSPPEYIYYPFGCNSSQKMAVERALTHQVSIIQGPPGTGKTQTILNIIANLLINGKTVLVVSNNNSAVENVQEKLSAEGLGFIVAKLGNKVNREAFIANQPAYPAMNDWMIEHCSDVKEASAKALMSISQGFETQITQAKLKSDYDALLKESTYNIMLEAERPGIEWLKKRSTKQLLKLLNLYRRISEKGKKLNLLFRLMWIPSFGFRILSFLKEDPAKTIPSLESAFYAAHKRELENELQKVDSILGDIDMEQHAAALRSTSLQLLKNYIARRYANRTRKKFRKNDFYSDSDNFIEEYPVVLSTTYSAKACMDKDKVFDYVIMDEASQVDIKTGALALSCAMNAVIVGDDKQLPNVVDHNEELALNVIQSTFHIDDRYNAVTQSFLSSCVEVFKDAPSTLLREHYRCHPKIIEFCNKRFYGNELVTMTTDSNEDNVLKVMRSKKGNHARGTFNQREIDIICQDVLPEYKDSGTLGIITPYRLQADEINRTLGMDIASTVHKYQGRECDTIIMSMVDNQVTDFSDNPNLLNVAISRAKKRLCIVTNGNEMDLNSNLAQLIAYIQYNNFEVKESRIHSVFDLLYKQYTAERLAYESSNKSISNYLSENLVYNLLMSSIDNLQLSNIAILLHYPMSKLIANSDMLSEEEKVFAMNPLTHLDFLLYNTLTKRPLMAIEVDGWHFHKESEVQQSRDRLKDHILGLLNLPLKRISTTDTVNEDTMTQFISYLY